MEEDTNNPSLSSRNWDNNDAPLYPYLPYFTNDIHHATSNKDNVPTSNACMMHSYIGMINYGGARAIDVVQEDFGVLRELNFKLRGVDLGQIGAKSKKFEFKLEDQFPFRLSLTNNRPFQTKPSFFGIHPTIDLTICNVHLHRKSLPHHREALKAGKNSSEGST
eukprot:scaffold93163_cov24-Cyclotella_meneghiniana.AAC.2